MASFEEKSDQFTRRKIQGFGSGNFAECLKMLQKIQNPGKLTVLKRKVINLQEGKFKVSDQEISQNA